MKNIFIKSTIILVIGGFFTKVLGLLTKIVLTRMIGTTGIGLYSMIIPTLLLLNSIAQLSLPNALNVLISSKKYNNKNIIFTAILISLFIEIIIFIILLIIYRLNLLNESLSLGILSIGFILPFITVSNALRSYYFAKLRVIPHVITNILEDLIKLILIIIGVPYFIQYGYKIVIAYIVLTNILCELSSIIIFLILLPKFKCTKKDLIPNKNNVKSLLNISIPITTSRLIGTFGYFLEPIIITFVLLKVGYSNSYIVSEYGIINGYVLQLVLLPSFFTSAISQILVPIISKNINNKTYVKNKIRQAIIISLLIGIPCTIIFTTFPKFLLQLFFNTNKGIPYIKVIAPICLLHYIQAPLSSFLTASNNSKIVMKSSLYSTIIRTSILFTMSFLEIGLWSLIIATSINIIFVTSYELYNVKNIIKKISS